ncbi:DUF4411 family protein [Amycolatopsis sp. TRM77291]
MKSYSIDTNVLIESWQRLYRPRTFSTYWTNLDSMIASGCLRASEEVKIEIDKRDDELKVWSKQRPDLFVAHEHDVQLAVREALLHCKKMAGSHKGHNGADPWVIALAKARGMTVVTLENKTGNLEKPKVPDVCEVLGVPWLNLYDFIEQQDWSF